MRFKFKNIIFIILSCLMLLFFIILGVSPFFVKTTSTVTKPTPGNYKTNYSNFNKLTPGKNTRDDIIALNGSPISEKKVGLEIFMYYSTPNPSINNIAVIENGVLKYATEEVYSKYRGSPDDYTKTLGQPEMIMNDVNDEIIKWWVFPDRGIAVAISPFENVVVKITYFIPQSKTVFIERLSRELGLTTQNVVPTEILENIN